MLVEALALGVVQGLLEWLPVSSSGQLAVILALLLHATPEAAYQYAMLLHLGTAAAGALVVWELVAKLLHGDKPLLRFALVSFLASLPVGYPLYLIFAEGEVGGLTPRLLEATVGSLLVASAALIHVSRRLSGYRWEPPSLLESIGFGLVQGLAALPGLSRSAVTVAYLCLRGYHPEAAVKYSILAGVLVTGAAGLYQLLHGVPGVAPVDAAAALAASFAAGVASAEAMIQVARRLPLDAFLAVMGAALLALAAAGLY